MKMTQLDLFIKVSDDILAEACPGCKLNLDLMQSTQSVPREESMYIPYADRDTKSRDLTRTTGQVSSSKVYDSLQSDRSEIVSDSLERIPRSAQHKNEPVGPYVDNNKAASRTALNPKYQTPQRIQEFSIPPSKTNSMEAPKPKPPPGPNFVTPNSNPSGPRSIPANRPSTGTTPSKTNSVEAPKPKTPADPNFVTQSLSISPSQKPAKGKIIPSGSVIKPKLQVSMLANYLGKYSSYGKTLMLFVQEMLQGITSHISIQNKTDK
ncbi:hypothetical protein QAD02_003828 [Eretmocerus hayati]|uniref:Uncharacterized protein n=1 Tax=Eretmocerus hayati TaxID=131215 RepID=A0ACC2NNA5_9HYME|nr:hypothetical protein QAD02_003828 [Eretmocerus hayati]